MQHISQHFVMSVYVSTGLFNLSIQKLNIFLQCTISFEPFIMVIYKGVWKNVYRRKTQYNQA